MPGDPDKPALRVLEPIERISEVLFGLIMVLTATGALSVLTADRAQIRTLVIGALGCNLAWGIIDAGMYLMERLNERGRAILAVRGARSAVDPPAAQRIIVDALPPLVGRALSDEHLEAIRQRLNELPAVPERPRLTPRDWLGALGVCLLVFFATLPVVIPFIFIGDPTRALRVSNVVAIAMLFGCGFAFGRHAGLRPWAMGLAMVALGGVCVGVAIALGG
jgi:hypothetical protein